MKFSFGIEVVKKKSSWFKTWLHQRSHWPQSMLSSVAVVTSRGRIVKQCTAQCCTILRVCFLTSHLSHQVPSGCQFLPLRSPSFFLSAQPLLQGYVLSADSSLYQPKIATAPRMNWGLSSSGKSSRPCTPGCLSPQASVHPLVHRLLSGSPGHQLLAP